MLCDSASRRRRRSAVSVRDLMIETGVLDKKIDFEEYTEVRFAEAKKNRTAWRYEPGDARAE